MIKSWRAMTLWKRVFVGLFIGILIGLGLHYGLNDTTEKLTKAAGDDVPKTVGQNIAETWFKPFGDAFVNLIRMLIVPLIVTTLVSGMVAMGDAKRLGSLGIKTVSLYLLTTFFAVWLGLAVATIFQPGAGLGELISAGNSSYDTVADKLAKAGDAKRSMTQYLLDIIPANPVKAMAEGDMLAIIFFSIIIGVGILLAGKKGKLLGDFFDSASEVVMRVTMMIMELAPYGVLALMAWVMGVNGLGILVNMGKLAAALYIACILQIVFVYGGLIIRTILKLPFVRYIYGIADAVGVAFSTSSSSATLPVTISCAEKNLGVDKSVAGSVLPMGATINMDGTAIYLGIVALFAAQALNLDLNMGIYMTVALTATMVSIGTAGIPSASLFLAVGMLQSIFGIVESEAILIVAFIFPFDRLLDMMRTVTNISGDVAVACAVAKSEGQLDEEVFKTKSVV